LILNCKKKKNNTSTQPSKSTQPKKKVPPPKKVPQPKNAPKIPAKGARVQSTQGMRVIVRENAIRKALASHVKNDPAKVSILTYLAFNYHFKILNNS